MGVLDLNVPKQKNGCASYKYILKKLDSEEVEGSENGGSFGMQNHTIT